MDEVNIRQIEPYDAEESELRQLLWVIWKRRIWAISIFIVSLVIASLYVSTLVPVYSSDAMLRIEEKNNPLNLLDELPYSPDILSEKRGEAEIIRSRRVVGATVDELLLDLNLEPANLSITDKLKNKMGFGEPVKMFAGGFAQGRDSVQVSKFSLPIEEKHKQFYLKIIDKYQYQLLSEDSQVLLQGNVGVESVSGDYQITLKRLSGAPGQLFSMRYMQRTNAIKQLQGRINIVAGGRNAQDIIRLSIEDTSPEFGTKILNTLIKHYVAYNISSHTAVTEKTLEFVEGQLKKFSGDMAFNNELYMLLLTKAHQLRVMKAGELGNIHVVDYAVIPRNPVGPNSVKYFLAIAFAGLGLGILAAFLRNTMDKALYDPLTVEQGLNLPVYSTIPLSQNQLKANKRIWKDKENGRSGQSLLFRESVDDPAMEAMRFLRTTLDGGELHVEPHSIIAITGPGAGVGKSFITANLSCLVAELGKKVLVVDADMRRGTMHEYFSLENSCGLAEYLSGTVTKEAIIKYSGLPNLDIITRGASPGNSSVLMSSSQLKILLDECRAEYDLVLIDTPPALAVTDGTIVSRYSDRLMIVIRSGVTTMDDVSACWRILTQSGKKPSGLVMSGFDASKSGYYGKYRQYAYY